MAQWWQILLQDSKKLPVLGRVLDKRDKEFNIHYYQGSYCKRWAPHMVYDRKSKTPVAWTQWLPKACIILIDFVLVDEKLTPQQKKFLSGKYKDFEKKSC